MATNPRPRPSRRMRTKAKPAARLPQVPGLEYVLHGQLEHACRSGGSRRRGGIRGDQAEGARPANVHAGVAWTEAVGHIETFETQLDVLAFHNAELPRERHVPLPEG